MSDSIVSKKPVRIGILGLGHVAQHHLDAYAHEARSHIVAVCDTDQQRVRKAVETYGGDGYQDLHTMLEEADLDAVSICLPPAMHRAAILAAAREDLFILAEKPIGTSFEDAAEIARALGSHRDRVLVGLCHRFHMPVKWARARIDEGLLGTPRMYRARFADLVDRAPGSWYAEREQGGGLIQESFVHAVDLFRWLLHDEVEEAIAGCGTFLEGMRAEDTAIVTVRGRSGALGVIEGSYVTPRSENRIEIHGDRGAIVIDYTSNTSQLRCDNRFQESGVTLDPLHRFKDEIDHFISCVLAEASPEITMADALAAQSVTAAAMASDTTRAWYRVSDASQLLGPSAAASGA